INSGSKTSYKYVILDKNGKIISEEDFERTYSDKVASINEVYNRKNKNVNVVSLPHVYDPLFSNGTKNIREYNDDQIYTIYANCNEEAYTDLKYSPFIGDRKNENSAECNVTFVTKTNIYQTTGKLELIGYNSRKYKKLSWKIKLEEPIFGRKSIKLRANANDPTMMRDKISSELYRALGVPTYSSGYIRVMINDDIYGLYNLVDSINKKWIAPFLYGDDNAHVGSNYKTYAGADLKYLGESDDAYSSHGGYELDKFDETDIEANGREYYRLAKFTKLFSEWNSKYKNDQSQAAVDALEKFFHLESLLRQMVIESLTFAHDNFWANSNNFIIYYNPELDIYQLIPHDFDGSFNGNLSDARFSENYTTDINDCINWANHSREKGDTYFISALFNHNIIKNRYNEIMKDTVYNLFNVDSVAPLIDSISSLIEDDIAWNFGLIDSLDSEIPGFVNHFTLKNFKDNTNYKNVDYLQGINVDDALFGLKEWIQLRSNQCKNYVKNLGLSSGTTNKKITTTITRTAVATTTNNQGVQCWSLVEGYPCCSQKNIAVAYVSKSRGVKYGIENGNWCGIIENNTPTTPTTKTTTKRTIIQPTYSIPISTVEDRCGPEYGRCKYEYDCCSKFGHCGNHDEFCMVSLGCQKGYGLCY
ncbi:carbohydrate-binding module family 18 protein, partial [Piromyces sp. E2]